MRIRTRHPYVIRSTDRFYEVARQIGTQRMEAAVKELLTRVLSPGNGDTP